ncbi:MAG: hypothetical protein EA393_03475 [Bacteroidetes bacterium]|nr:MAG: hypothetical protein EA393_03475 [Bacteroidota bacterium]
MKDLLCNLSSWFYEKSKNNLVLLLLLAVFLSFNAIIMPYFAKLYGLQDQVLLDLQFGFTPEFAYTVLAGYGEYGRQGIMVFTGIVDNIYPLVYGSLLAFSISRLKRKADARNSSCQFINLIPFTAVLFDFMENTGILIMIQNYPDKIIPVAWATSFAGMFKWILVVSSILILLFYLLKTFAKPLIVKP